MRIKLLAFSLMLNWHGDLLANGDLCANLGAADHVAYFESLKTEISSINNSSEARSWIKNVMLYSKKNKDVALSCVRDSKEKNRKQLFWDISYFYRGLFDVLAEVNVREVNIDSTRDEIRFRIDFVGESLQFCGPAVIGCAKVQ